MSAKEAQTVGNAVEQRDQQVKLGDLVTKYQGDFAQVLPSHISSAQWMRLAQGALRRDPSLGTVARSNQGSLMAALLDCARLGHEPGTDAYALVAYGNEIVGIEQYQGQIERMYRAGGVRTVKVEVVRENDLYEYHPDEMDRPRHRKGWFCTDPPGGLRHGSFAATQDRGPMVGVYAYADLTGGGTSRVVEMGRDEVMLHKAAARTKKFWEGDWESAMWRKTAIHELEKYVPTSAEFMKEKLRAAAEAERMSRDTNIRPVQMVDPDTEEIVDADVIEPSPSGVEVQETEGS